MGLIDYFQEFDHLYLQAMLTNYFDPILNIPCPSYWKSGGDGDFLGISFEYVDGQIQLYAHTKSSLPIEVSANVNGVFFHYDIKLLNSKIKGSYHSDGDYHEIHLYDEKTTKTTVLQEGTI